MNPPPGPVGISVIIPVYNRPDFLREAVESALAQEGAPVEIILSDDGSTDASGPLADRLAAERPGIIRALHSPNRGPGPAREAGRRIARGEFIQYLDSDDRLCPGKFRLQVEALRRDPSADIAYGATRLMDARGAALKEPFKWTGRRMERLFPALLVDRWWCTHTPLYRRSLCDRIGPWSDLPYSQDWEYDARAGALGARLAWVGATVSEHRCHEGMRQTGGGRWLSPPDQARFFRALLSAAARAGVPAGAPERRHFSRWVFSSARRAALAGDRRSARRLLAISRAAAGEAEPLDMAVFRRLARGAGLRFASGLYERLHRLRGGRPGPGTRRQSWMEPEPGRGPEEGG